MECPTTDNRNFASLSTARKACFLVCMSAPARKLGEVSMDRTSGTPAPRTTHVWNSYAFSDRGPPPAAGMTSDQHTSSWYKVRLAEGLKNNACSAADGTAGLLPPLEAALVAASLNVFRNLE